MTPQFEPELVKMRSLLGSLLVILDCMSQVDRNDQAIGSAVFLLTELNKTIDKIEKKIVH